ncbi:GDP-mannose 4,6-dehydratase, partial [Candidatus Peregrinibacteria bacterium]|nr:GDP-mannose 4,6-dehydratase [Candidatus Peregrinibacteria bacterium]
APEYAEGMWRILQQEKPDDYLLATGRTASVREFLELCLMRMGYAFETKGEGLEEKYIDTKTGKVIVEIDTLYHRPAEVDALLGDPSKAKRELGWEAKTTLEQLADIMLQADCTLFGVSL